ncbi:hypothetical protein IEU95_12900 [Hoyosella rhizosphaerae]|uniref:DUF2267 domain-containing protein n=1 Tax=Hoyosella rhizosphaerae TaxID=1755582 RepID=A0A916XBM9_9ACTN|nr:hypothetical protein [Hoyosella rhizosphaerae]MBN4927735.1 hypothetical protein [Hoyosella rhizosphaerae]GGC61999.1 hypothetical protein GCM10011410_13080 [Hoyosella rhizosphaerae]
MDSEITQWDVTVRTRSFPLNDNGEILLSDAASSDKEDADFDIVVGVTELPRLTSDGPAALDMTPDADIALISLPGLGPLGLRSKLAQEIRTILQAEPPLQQTTQMVRFPAMLRLLLGMVRVNRPWRLVPSLSSAMAAAGATAAFGVFYSSIWEMATALSPLRLSLITAMSITAMTLWLIIYNRLWDSPRHHGSRVNALVYNVATVLTLVAGVGLMYLGLYLATFAAALTVISWDFLGATLGEPAALAHYATLAWLATSMGTVAGALGSSAEDTIAIQRAAFGNREQERRQAQESRENDHARR